MDSESDAGDNYLVHRYLRLAERAAAQFGVVSLDDLHAIGFDKRAISYARQIGRLHPIFPGAYAVGHRRLTRDGWFMAALLSYGPDSVLSHFSAAMVHQIWKYRVNKIHVKRPRKARKRLLVEPHHCRTGITYETVNGLRITSIEQTILDMATVVRSDKAYRRVVREALVQQLISYEQLVEFADASDGAPGIRRMRQELQAPARTRSSFEDEILDDLRAQGFDPAQNLALHGIEVDLFLPEYNLVIEVDGPAHDNPLAEQDDARTQARLEAGGLRVLRLPSRRRTRASP